MFPTKYFCCCKRVENQFMKRTSFNCWLEAPENNYSGDDLEEGSEKEQDEPDHKLLRVWPVIVILTASDRILNGLLTNKNTATIKGLSTILITAINDHKPLDQFYQRCNVSLKAILALSIGAQPNV